MSNTPARPCTTTALLWQNSLRWISTPSATCLSMVASSACGLQPLVQTAARHVTDMGDTPQLSASRQRFEGCSCPVLVQGCQRGAVGGREPLVAGQVPEQVAVGD